MTPDRAQAETDHARAEIECTLRTQPPEIALMVLLGIKAQCAAELEKCIVSLDDVLAMSQIAQYELEQAQLRARKVQSMLHERAGNAERVAVKVAASRDLVRLYVTKLTTVESAR